jgi:uncharacterized protein YbjT (DUF2867 family)
MSRILIAGSTGLVGRHVLERLLADDRWRQVVAPTRRPLASHPKLVNPIVDYDALPLDAPWWEVDAAISTLGTTLRQAGSREAFRAIDHGYTLAIARAVHNRGATRFGLNSALGADPGSLSFYLRTKGEIERDIEAIGFPSLVIVRPGLLGGERTEVRTGERIGLVVAKALEPILPRKWRISEATRVAASLVDGVTNGAAGLVVVSSEDLAQ